MNNMFNGLCGSPGSQISTSTFCDDFIPTGEFDKARQRTSRRPVRALPARGESLGPRRDAGNRLCRHACLGPLAAPRAQPQRSIDNLDWKQQFGTQAHTSFQDLDIFMLGGVIFF